MGGGLRGSRRREKSVLARTGIRIEQKENIRAGNGSRRSNLMVLLTRLHLRAWQPHAAEAELQALRVVRLHDLSTSRTF